MNLSQITICLVLAVAATIVAQLVVRRERRQLWFEIVLWIGTGVVAFLGSILAVAAASGLGALQALTVIQWQELPLVPALLGALGGALLLNVPLGVLGRYEYAGEDLTGHSDQIEEG